MKTESKQDLRDRIDALEKQILQRDEAERAAKMLEWKKHLPEAFDFARDELNRRMSGKWRTLALDHIDESGFYFTYELYEGLSCWVRQSIRVRHEEATTDD